MTTLNGDGSVAVSWSPVDGAMAYVVHYGDPGKTARNAIYMGYSETADFTLATDKVPAHVTGDKIYFYVQAYPIVGQGTDGIAKAEYLNTAEVTGSEWSKVASVTFE